MREFLHVDDMAEACVFLLKNYSGDMQINVGYGEDIRIMDAAKLVARVIGYAGEITEDPQKPDGTPRKLLDCSRIFNMGWKPRISLEEGIQDAYQDFLRRYEKSG